MKRKYPTFTAGELSDRINEYFIFIKGKYRTKRVASKDPKKREYAKVCDREPEHPTISGLALFLGFTSRHHFDEYEQKGKHAQILKQGRLRIEAAYEKRLHEHYTSGPIFALKSLGWNDAKTTEQAATRSLNIKIIETGPKPAHSEKEVIIDYLFPHLP